MMIPMISPRTVSSLRMFAVIFADRRERRIVWNRRKGQDDIALAELEYFNAFEPFKCAAKQSQIDVTTYRFLCGAGVGLPPKRCCRLPPTFPRNDGGGVGFAFAMCRRTRI